MQAALPELAPPRFYPPYCLDMATEGIPFAAADDGAARPIDYYRHLNRHKFTVELEFLSSLASPSYLTHLYTLGHLHDPAFIRYVAHLLRTWSTPPYVRFLRFPNALLFGSALVKSAAFRQAVGADGWEHEVTQELIAAWAGHPSSSTASSSLLQAQEEGHNEGGLPKDPSDDQQVSFAVKHEPNLVDNHHGNNSG